MKKYKFQICEIHGKKLLEVVSGEANTQEEAEKELNHYAMLYSQDYPIKIWKNW